MNYLRYWAIRLGRRFNGVIVFCLIVYAAQVASAVDGLLRGDLVQELTGWLTAFFTTWVAGRYLRAMRRNRSLGEPIPPRDVRALMRDGTEIPVELIYVGVWNGMHAWRLVNCYRQGDIVDIRPRHPMPPNTVIQVHFHAPAEDET